MTLIPTQITFRGLAPNDALEQEIWDTLTRRFPELQAA